MKKMNTAAAVAAKILEILHWLGGAAALVVFVISFASPHTIADMTARLNGQVAIYGVSMSAAQPGGSIGVGGVRVFSVAAFFIFTLMAMVFRNVYLIFRTSKGKTWFAKGETPFQNDVVRMVREIGIFSISVPVVGLLVSVVARLVMGVDAVEWSVDLGGFVTGILVLCLSQVFAYGMRLQSDVDGLL